MQASEIVFHAMRFSLGSVLPWWPAASLSSQQRLFLSLPPLLSDEWQTRDQSHVATRVDTHHRDHALCAPAARASVPSRRIRLDATAGWIRSGIVISPHHLTDCTSSHSAAAVDSGVGAMSSFARVDTRRTPSTRHADGRASDEDDDESEDEEQPSQHQHQHYQEPEEDWSRPHFQPSHHPPAHRSSASSSPHRPPSRLYQKSYTARNLRPREVTPRRSQPSKDEAAYGRDGAPEELGWIGRSIGAGSSTLWLFTACQILIFYDRGMVAGFLPSVQRDIGGLSDTEAGVLGSGFIFGYMLACPLFAFFSKSISPYKLMALGLFLWSAATLACGLSEKFIPLLTARILTGVGEASFAGLAPTCIDDVAPMKHRTIWLSFFFAGIPLGSAAGYVSGGYFAKAGWHVGFLLEAAVMLPLVVIVFFWPNHEQSVKATAEVASREKSQIRRTNSWARMPRPDDGQIRGPGYTQYGSTTEDQTRLLPSPPVPTQGQQPQQQAHLLPAMLGDHSGHFVRSVSTPSLKRLDSTPHGADEQKQQRERPIPESPSSAAASIEQQQPQLPASQAGDDADEKHSAPPTPSGRSGRTSRARTPRAMDRAYITPDPSNPFHVAPAVSANAAPTTAPIATDAASLPHSALRVRTPGYQEQVAYRHQMDLAHLHTDAPVTPTAHLPSPSSFNPHYAARAALSHSAARSTTDAQGRLIHPSDADGLPSVDEDMFVTDIITLLTDGVYIVVVLGYAALAFVIGALSFWGPVDFAIHLHIGLGRSTRMIGAITFVCGLGGTFFGGWVRQRGEEEGHTRACERWECALASEWVGERCLIFFLRLSFLTLFPLLSLLSPR